MQVVLRVVNSKSNVRQLRLTSRTTIIGRGAECQLKVVSDKVSRRHCELVVHDQWVTVKDLASSNGTYVNGHQIPPNVEVPLTPGTKVGIGSLLFSVEYEWGENSIVDAPARDTNVVASGTPSDGKVFDPDDTRQMKLIKAAELNESIESTRKKATPRQEVAQRSEAATQLEFPLFSESPELSSTDLQATEDPVPATATQTATASVTESLPQSHVSTSSQSATPTVPDTGVVNGLPLVETPARTSTTKADSRLRTSSSRQSKRESRNEAPAEVAAIVQTSVTPVVASNPHVDAEQPEATQQPESASSDVTDAAAPVLLRQEFETTPAEKNPQEAAAVESSLIADQTSAADTLPTTDSACEFDFEDEKRFLEMMAQLETAGTEPQKFEQSQEEAIQRLLEATDSNASTTLMPADMVAGVNPDSASDAERPLATPTISTSAIAALEAGGPVTRDATQPAGSAIPPKVATPSYWGTTSPPKIAPPPIPPAIPAANASASPTALEIKQLRPKLVQVLNVNKGQQTPAATPAGTRAAMPTIANSPTVPQHQSAIPKLGHLMGFDHHSNRTGFAICNSDQTIASLIESDKQQEPVDAKRIQRLITDHNIVGLVVSLPVLKAGEETPKSQECRKFAAWLSQVTTLPVTFADERSASRFAAQVMLQGYLEANRSKKPTRRPVFES